MWHQHTFLYAIIANPLNANKTPLQNSIRSCKGSYSTRHGQLTQKQCMLHIRAFTLFCNANFIATSSITLHTRFLAWHDIVLSTYHTHVTHARHMHYLAHKTCCISYGARNIFPACFFLSHSLLV